MKIRISEEIIYVPENAIEFLKFWQEKLDILTDEQKETACIEYESNIRYGDAELDIMFSYQREETDEERCVRVGEELVAIEKGQARELQEFNRLKDKLGL